jgi:TetR/AcrR family transcriptional regulator, tetracycline repressor protein
MRKTIQTAGRKAARKPDEAASVGSRAGLDRDRLVDAAIDLLQEKGLDALSTRQLAERLGVKSPALYWHIRDKSELLGLVADAICARMALPASNRSFRERLEDIAWEYRRVLVAHRDAPRLFVELAPTGAHRMKLYDAAVGAFLDAGFAPPEAIAMATFYRNYLLGMVAEEARQSWSTHSNALRPTVVLGSELARLGDESPDYPNLSGAAELLAKIEPEALFRIGLKVLLDGMECRKAEFAQPGKAKRAGGKRPGAKP